MMNPYAYVELYPDLDVDAASYRAPLRGTCFVSTFAKAGTDEGSVRPQGFLLAFPVTDAAHGCRLRILRLGLRRAG